MRNKDLLIIGAGPKAMAIAAKATVLYQMGLADFSIHIVEKCAVGAHWSGLGGYTNGKMELGTSPEKDVGFPYRTTLFDDSTTRGVKQNREINLRTQVFSWNSFLIQQGKFSEWVDRGRPSPTHAMWANYLLWVSENLGGNVHIHYGKVNKVSLHTNHWETTFQTDTGTRTLSSSGLVLTGPGKIRKALELSECNRVLDVESFWKQLSQLSLNSARIGIVGAGENAASIALALARSHVNNVSFNGEVEIISPSGFIFSRGESYRENQVYSDPDSADWKSLSVKDRREFVRRTDLGVFSQYALKYLDGVDNIRIVAGRLIRTASHQSGALTAEVQTHQGTIRRDYDYLVMATGFDQAASLSSILDKQSCLLLEQRLCIPVLTQSELEKRISTDLAIENLNPKLHLPALAGLMQGPGFANLSSLGRLADQLLRPYLQEKVLYEKNSSSHPYALSCGQ